MSIHRSGAFALVVVIGLFASHSVHVQEDPTFDPSDTPTDAVAPEDYQLSSLRIFNRTMLLVKEQYVEPERIQPREMLNAALKATEQRVPEILVGDTSKDKIRVQVGNKAEVFPIGPMNSLWDLSFEMRDIFRFVEQNLPKERNKQEIEYAAINGTLSKLDPHSIVLEPKFSKEMNLTTKGEFGGLGVVIGIRDGVLTVISPLDGTPADKAGIKALDRVVKIGDNSTINESLDEAVDELRGKPGTPVNLTIERKGESIPRKIRIVRAIIKVESVTQQLLSNNIGYIRVKGFHRNTASDMKNMIEDQKKRSGNKLKGMILDFRNNPGGLLEQSVAIADLFLDGGVVVVTQGSQAEKRDEELATRGASKTELPIIVLVNGGSASASEIVAGAIKNRERGLVMGEQTFGKGSVQMLYDFPDKSSLKLTIAQYLTPGNESIQSVGITPDIALHPVYAKDLAGLSLFEKDYTREEDLEAHLDDSTRVISRKPSFVLSHLDAKEDLDQLEKQALSSKVKEDFDIGLAKRILVATKGSTRIQMMEAAKTVISEAQREEALKIEASLKKIGIDWTPPPATASTAQISAALVQPVIAKAGNELEINVSVKNTGTTPIYQLYGLSDSRTGLLSNKEFVFGKLGPLEKRNFSVKIKLPKDALARRDILRIKFSGNAKADFSSLDVPVQIQAAPMPIFAYSVYADDSRLGNGDGYLEADEKVDLVFAVKNIGKGDAEEPVILLKNLAGSDVFIDEGRKKLPKLKAGQSALEKLSFTVHKEAKAAKLQIQIYDSELGVYWSEKMDIPIRVAAPKFAKVQGRVQIARDQAALYEEPTSDTPVFAKLKVGSEGEQLLKVGEMVRVRFSPTISGFVKASDLSPAKIGQVKAKKEEASVAWDYRRTPPKIELAAGSPLPLVAKGHFHLGAKVMDESALKDAFIFVNDQKVFYRQYDQKGPGNISFETDVKLKPGVNVITMVAREDENYAQRESITVFSEEGDPFKKSAEL